jgi:hypothetical protein
LAPIDRPDRSGRLVAELAARGGRAAPGFPALPRKECHVSAEGLIHISTSANDAFGAFDWSANAGKGVRLFVQGFG